MIKKLYDYLLITYMKKFNGRSVSGSKGSCLLNVCSMFGSTLENLGKSTGECKNKHSDNFPKFLKIFANLRKSSEIFGKIGKCRKVLKTTFQHFKNFYEIFGNHRKSSEVFGCLRKSSEN